MKQFYKVRFYAFMLISLGLFAAGLAITEPFAHWLGMIGGLYGFGLNLYGQIHKPSDEPFPPDIPNQRAITRALFGAMAILLVPVIVVVLVLVFLGGDKLCHH